MFNVTVPYESKFNNAEDRINTYKSVFSSPDGKMVVEDIVCKICRIGDDVYSNDINIMLRESARQKVGLELLKILNKEVKK